MSSMSGSMLGLLRPSDYDRSSIRMSCNRFRDRECKLCYSGRASASFEISVRAGRKVRRVRSRVDVDSR